VPLYFAYGSNLDETQMLERCPGARRTSTAILPAHRLNFVGHSRKWGGGVATVVSDPAAYTLGILYEMPDHEFVVLDGYEGVLGGTYTRGIVTVRATDDTSTRAETYVHAKTTWRGPSDKYLDVIRAAYARYGFDISLLEAAAADRLL